MFDLLTAHHDAILLGASLVLAATVLSVVARSEHPDAVIARALAAADDTEGV